MDAFLTQPAVQSGLLPLGASLLLGGLLLRLPARWQGLVIVVAFLLAVLSILGPTLLPLTSTRKIVLACLALPLLALLLDGLRFRARFGLLAVGATGALLWVLWPVLMRQAPGDAFVQGGGLALYVVVLLFAFARLGQGCARFAGAALIVSPAAGAAAILAASALYGQLLFSLAAATGGLALWRLFRPSADVACFGFAGVVAVALPVALLSAAATVYAGLPVTVLPALLVALALAMLPVFAARQPWQRAAAAAGLALLPSLVAVYLAWSVVEDAGYSGY